MKTILLNENIYGTVSREETFWSVLAKALPDCQAISLNDFKGDVENFIAKNPPKFLIFNALLGNIKAPANVFKIAFLQDNFLAMKKLMPWRLKSLLVKTIKLGNDFYNQKIKKQKSAITNADLVVAASQDIANWYKIKAEIIPVGTSPELFKPMDKAVMRRKHNIPLNEFVKIYVGSTHPVKGWDLLYREIAQDKDSFYILVFKDNKIPKLDFKNIKTFNRVAQETLSELYNCADLYVGRSRVESLWLAPLEAMFCDVPLDVTATGIFADWQPQNKNPRQEALERGLDQDTMIEKWKSLLAAL